MRHDLADEDVDFLLAGLAGKNAHYPARFGPPARVVRARGRTIVDSGLASDTFNLVVEGRDDPGEGPGELEAACRHFSEPATPAAWWTCDGLRGPRLEAALARHGFVEDEADVGMVADLARLPPAPARPAGLETRPAESAADFEAFGRVVAANFDPPDEHVLTFYRRIGALPPRDREALPLFVGFVDGSPACTASLFLDGSGAHLFDVCTLAAFRGRGLGSAMAHFALAHGRDRRGARRAGLQASPGGVGIYRRLGFEPACTFRTYSNKQHVARRSTPREGHGR